MGRARWGIAIGGLSAGGMAAALLGWSALSATNAAPIPDFSGIWGRTSVDFEPPPSGAGPVMNKTRTFYMRVGDDTNPILKPEAAEEVRKAGAISRTGTNFPTPSNQCTPWSPPYAWRALQMQILQQKDQVTLLYVGDQQIRRVRLNQPHPANVTPSWGGDSVGHYEGDTLVIDTVGVRVGPLSVVDNYGTPYSAALHLVERIRLVDGDVANAAAEQAERDSGRVDVEMGGATIDPAYKGKGLQVQFRVEDAGMFTGPWSAAVTLRRAVGRWEERVCADSRFNYITGKPFPLPQADNADF
ncbi:MAG TPA: hypothetical protein VK479_10945 [Micropepsaceae bacterium]|nr:hypothetical protein [Micropepsaceae bacterium]